MARNPTKVEVPGEEPQAEEGAVAEQPAAAPQTRATKVADAPDADDVDPATIPYGKTVMTKQGILCSTAEPPPLQRQNQR